MLAITTPAPGEEASLEEYMPAGHERVRWLWKTNPLAVSLPSSSQAS
jgi:hypothetical protein